MATKQVELDGNFVKVNNGGLIKTSGCMIICKSDYIFFGTVAKDAANPPEFENCFIVKNVINYGGSDDVYIRARDKKAVIIVDNV